MYATDRQTDVRQIDRRQIGRHQTDRRQPKASLNAPAYYVRGHNNSYISRAPSSLRIQIEALVGIGLTYAILYRCVLTLTAGDTVTQSDVGW